MTLGAKRPDCGRTDLLGVGEPVDGAEQGPPAAARVGCNPAPATHSTRVVVPITAIVKPVRGQHPRLALGLATRAVDLTGWKPWGRTTPPAPAHPQSASTTAGARDEAKIRETWGDGRIGTLAVALSGERQSTVAWKSGAAGEAEVGRTLDAIASEHVVVFHDRRIPRSRANIDHIVITRAGVWVIDAKRYRNKRPRLQVEGGLFRPRTEKLIVGGDRTKLVDGVLLQVALVQDVVAPASVRGVLCFVDADWPLFGGSFTVRGIDVCWPRRLSRQLTALEGAVDVTAVAAAIAAHFPPA
ncbi:nuclease-related domain-containing protein [Curtobacterium sp. AB451]|uniref:nuclease-related domain-containing protein n=1 Tax=Curtobacterium sp. AB451 TaxID=3422306 RepID=UPI003D3467E7